MKQIKLEFYAKGTETGKRTVLFNLMKTRPKEYNSMSLSEKILAIAFLESCKSNVQGWINELKK